MTKLEGCVAALAAFLTVSGCVEQAVEGATVGWTCLPSYGGCDEYGFFQPMPYLAVGLPVEWRLVAQCNTGQWNFEAAEIVAGRLPPGLEIEPDSFAIVKAPTQAGTFSFQTRFRGISCPGSNYLPYGDWDLSYTIFVTSD
jgi:hypothetical protein